MIKIYENTISEIDRLKVLSMISEMPEPFWTQSICTGSSVDQLREYLPMEIFGIVNNMHVRLKPTIEKDFGVLLKDPEYNLDSMVTVDRRLLGYSLPMHKDIPTGDYIHHIGSEAGESLIEVSCVYYWNDQFTGGELYFDHEDFIYFPKAGDLVVFYSNMDHEVKEITSGVRYSTQYFFNKR